MKRLGLNVRTVGLLALTALAVAACGKRGTLERPPPMWGDKAKAEYQAEKAAEAKAKKDKQEAPAGTAKPSSIPPQSQNTSIRQDPVSVAPQDPYAGPGSPGPHSTR
jgi:predicted small lipoprotein YifL